MDKTTTELRNWAIQKIKTEYPDDVALLVALEGHSVDGDGHGECFDYFVPATERGNELAQTFIIDGVGTDLYPRSWERTERTAELDDRATICLGNAKIVYSRSEEDTARFEVIRQKLFDNLKNREFTYKKALENLNIAMDLYRTLMFEDALYKVRMAAGYICQYLSVAVACLNGTYFSDWRYGRLEELKSLKALPENFAEYYSAVLGAVTADELKSLSHLLLRTTRRFLAEHRPEREAPQGGSDFARLADWYQELCLTLRRLRYYCRVGNAEAAFIDACSLQSEMQIVGEEFGLREMDLLGCFDAADLSRVSVRSDELEAYIVSEIEDHGVEINRYDSLEEFLAKN